LRRDQRLILNDGFGASSFGHQKTGGEKRKLKRNHNALHIATHSNTVDRKQLKMLLPIVCVLTHFAWERKFIRARRKLGDQDLRI